MPKRLRQRPDIEILIDEAEEIRRRDPTVSVESARAAVAADYGAESWERLDAACRIADAIWNDDSDALGKILDRFPALIGESVLIRDTNWGPPLSFAATLGRTRIVRYLFPRGPKDTLHAIGRAALTGQVETAKAIHELAGRPVPPHDAFAGTAYTLDVHGTEFLLEIGARLIDRDGRPRAPVDVVLETDSRRPEAKHRILELYVANGIELPDTPVMALHRGRLDLLERHLTQDGGMLARCFAHEEIYPPELGCHDEVLATQGTPLAGTALLHLCVDYDELVIAEWLLSRGADPNLRALVDHDGFGGHTPLFCTTVSQPNFWMNHIGAEGSARFARLLLSAGAETDSRASLRKRLHPGYGPDMDTETTYEYRNVTAAEWGRQFHAQKFVDKEAIEVIDSHREHAPVKH